jgi:hypothetical protein
MSRPVEYLRADAARNVHRIVEVAARMLGENPHAAMGDVGAAAGVSRATVYRHFPTREALLRAIEEKQPRYAVCGHIHESWGCARLIHQTPVRNLGPTGTWVEV